MNAFTSRRAAASCGALALLLGVGALVPLSAQAATNPLDLGQTVSGLNTAVATTLNGTAPTPTPSASTLSVAGLDVALLPTTAPSSSTAIAVPGVVSVDAGGLLGGLTGSGTGTGTGTSTGSGGLGVTVGSNGDGGSLVSVNLGGTGTTTGGGTSTTTSTTTSTSSNSSTGSSTDTTTGTTSGSTPAPTASAAAAPAAVRVLGLAASPSVATVYPVKDGYRDDVVFRVAARLSSAAKTAVSGTAVLTRGSKAITQWTISQPTQDLRWNGLDHGKLVAGTYVLTATMKDATGATHTTTTKVVASPKRLIASTQKVSALSVSGTHPMAAAARAGLSRGTVTLRLTVVAPKVKGKQFLIFQKGTKQLKVRIKQGTHTTKAVAVPKELTSYTLKHTWKKGQVKLKSIRYTYSYQSLR